MRGLVVELLFVAAVVGGAFFVTRPTTWLGRVQVALTGLLGLVFVAEMQLAAWLHSMAYADPTRQFWQPRLSGISNLVWFGSLLVYALFTFYHLVVRSRPGPSHTGGA